MSALASEVADHESETGGKFVLDVQVPRLDVRVAEIGGDQDRRKVRRSRTSVDGGCLTVGTGGRIDRDGGGEGRIGSQSKDHAGDGMVDHIAVPAAEPGFAAMGHVTRETHAAW